MYVPSTRKVISSYNVLFVNKHSSALSYTSRPYAEAMAMRPAVTYTPYAMSSKEETGSVITFTQFEQHQKVYLVYVHSTRKVISLYNVVFDKKNLVRCHTRHDRMLKRWQCVRQ